MSGRQIMTADEIRRATTRISHEIVEKQAGTDRARARRHPAPRRAARAPHRRSRSSSTRASVVPVGALDITFYRDDLSLVAQQPIVKGTELPFEHRRRDDRARRRRAVHGPHDPRRDGRARRLRAAAGDPPRGARRPRPPRAADPRRPRRQERADVARGDRARPPRGDRRRGRASRSSGRRRRRRAVATERRRAEPRWSTRTPSPAIAVGRHRSPRASRSRWRHRHLLDVDDAVRGRARARHAHDRRDARGPAPGRSPRCRRCAARQRDDPVLRGVDADPRVVRGRGQEPLGATS